MKKSKYNITIPENLRDIIDIDEFDRAIEKFLEQKITLPDGREADSSLEYIQKVLVSESRLMTSLELMNESNSYINSLPYNQGA
jgi:hypothetical protein